MAHHPGPGRASARVVPRQGPRLAALLALATAAGLVGVLLALRALSVAGDLPSPRFETYLEIPLVGAGSLLAAWVSLSSALAASCVLVRGVGRRWAAGERLVLLHAPVLVRRLAGSGVAVSIGAGLVLGAGSAQAVETEPAEPATSTAVVDLGWQSTAPTATGTADPASHGAGPSVVPLAPAADEKPEALRSPDESRDGGTTDAATDAAAIDHAPPVPSVTDGAPEAASVSEAPRTHDTGASAPTPSPAGAEPGGPNPGHVPLSGLMGGTQRAAPAQSAGVAPLASPPPGGATPGGSLAAVPSSVAQTDASSVSVVVLRGDTLWSLAERALGQGATDAQITVEWQRWYAANLDVIGQDPDLIRPGQVLQAPLTA